MQSSCCGVWTRAFQILPNLVSFDFEEVGTTVRLQILYAWSVGQCGSLCRPPASRCLESVAARQLPKEVRKPPLQRNRSAYPFASAWMNLSGFVSNATLWSFMQK
jgi:hypothetical protein